MKKTSFRHYF